ncbi:MAG: peptidoglycan-binding domain-containing protein [Pseudomonadota bacterium]
MKSRIGTTTILSLLASGAMVASVNGQELPPASAKPGECYAKVLVPASYETTPEQVMIQPATTAYKKTPAVYREVEKSILVEEESFELVPVPPTYETVSETILVQPEQVIKTVVPATYRTEKKQVMISPARTEWKVGRGAYEKIDEATGEIMCLVEIPAVFNTVEHVVLDQAPQTKEEIVPAKYKTIERRVMKTPPTTRKKVLPARYETVIIKELVENEKFEVVETPARFTTVEKRKVLAQEAVKWRQILCETNTTPEIVKEIQSALINAGYKLGFAPDGELGPGTLAVVEKFQKDKGLPTGGLTISTLERLGVSTGGV